MACAVTDLSQVPDRFADRKETGAGLSVLIYSPQLMPAVQHYVREHALRLRRYRPVLAGRRRIDGIAFDDFPHFVFPRTASGRIREMSYLLAGFDRSLVSFIKREGIRLIHAHFGPGGAEILPIATRLGIPLVVTFHGWDVKFGIETRARMSAYERLYRRRLPQLFRRVERVICVSKRLQERAVAMGCPPDKVQTNYLGVDSTFFDGNRGRVDPQSILFVGRLVKQKGAHLLIEAMDLLRRRGVKAHLTVAGEGPEEKRLRTMAAQREVQARFLGRRSSVEIRELLRTAAVLCLPSTTAEGDLPEALGLVILEAQAMRVPVVATRNGGIPEAMEDGATGLLVDEHSADGLAEALAVVLSDGALNREFGDRARLFVCERFDIARCYRNLEAIYDSVLPSEKTEEQAAY